MHYGIPYQASKNRIAKQIVDLLPPAETFVDLFAGGCAVTHTAMLSGKWERFVVNDLGPGPEIFLAAIHGEFRDYATVPDREQFHAEKHKDPVLALLYSFGNNSRNYLWGKQIEGVKMNASRMLTAPSLYERKKHYRAFLRELKAYIEACGTKKLHTPKANGVEGLQRLEGLEGLERLERLEIYTKDYRQLSIPDNSMVYADPPYRGTKQESNLSGEVFDFDAFDRWLAEVDFPVFVSEFTCPEGCVEIARLKKRATMCATANSKDSGERLFIQARFAEWYQREMEKEANDGQVRIDEARNEV